MCKIIAVTNRQLCREPLLTRIERLAAGGVDVVLLREKDLPYEDYVPLAEQAAHICRRYGVELLLHSHVRLAADLGCGVHLPLPLLRECDGMLSARIGSIGSSVHSLDEAGEAVRLGADYLIAGHIYATDCKRGLAGRGTDWLSAVCVSAEVPVCGIGGITSANARAVIQAGAAGVCLMSSLMQTDAPNEFLRKLRNSLSSKEFSKG